MFGFDYYVVVGARLIEKLCEGIHVLIDKLPLIPAWWSTSRRRQRLTRDPLALPDTILIMTLATFFL